MRGGACAGLFELRPVGSERCFLIGGTARVRQRLSMKFAVVISVATAVAGAAGFCRANEVLPAPRGPFAQPVPFREAPSRLLADYGSPKRVQTIETGAVADHTFVVAQTSAASGPGVPPPDFRIPKGRGRLGILEPPARFLHWTDHVEMVLPSGDVVRRCQTAGARSAPGKRIHGCSYQVGGRCLIIRVDDPGVARHELAHCNGWTHPEP
jgi:hypothetical protein